MKEDLKFCCSEMEIHVCETTAVIYNEVFDEYVIPIPEDGVSVAELVYCPWCGKKLPESKREKWVVTLEEMGFEAPLFREDIPEEYKTVKWRKDIK